MRDGWSKWPLRQALADRNGAVPAWRRGKKWFGVPQRAWLRGPLAAQVEPVAPPTASDLGGGGERGGDAPLRG